MRCPPSLNLTNLVSLAKILFAKCGKRKKRADINGTMRWEIDYGKEKQELLSGKDESRQSFLSS